MGGASGIIAFLSSKQNRIKTKGKIRGVKESLFLPAIEKTTLPIKKAENPDPLDLIDKRMIDEGSLTSVNYYNKGKK